MDEEREGAADDGGGGGRSLMRDERSDMVTFELHDLRTESVKGMSCCCARVRRRL